MRTMFGLNLVSEAIVRFTGSVKAAAKAKIATAVQVGEFI